jgi:hypothetical protein
VFGNVIWSTGVLAREPETISAVANIVNLNGIISHRVTVEVWDWSNYETPVMVPVLIGENVPVTFPYLLGPQHLAVMYADLNANNVSLYEIRIKHTAGANIVANCFGRSVPPYTSKEGNTVYQKLLVQLMPGIFSMVQFLAEQVRLGNATMEQVASQYGLKSDLYQKLKALMNQS